jgi:predicted esterase
MKKLSAISLLIIISVTLLGKPTESPITKIKIPADTLIKLKNAGNNLNVYIKGPIEGAIRGVIIVLPGWNLPVMDWCTKTSLCQKALRQGYILIMPEMAKSIYASERFPETRKDWHGYATRTWFIDTLIHYFQNTFKLLLPHNNNYLLGLSTGARGVALLSLDCPKIFKKAAALSGDYDQTQMPKDALITGYYGPIDKFPVRWKGTDNIVFRCEELKTPIYLGHGRADKVVPVSQTLQFVDSLAKYKPGLVKCHIDEKAGHTYDYWNSEVDNVLDFFKAE